MTICWIRRDIRLGDHAALYESCRIGMPVALVFVFDTAILDALSDKDDRRLTFLHRSLVELDARLRAMGSRLVALRGDPVREIPALAEKLSARAVYANRDYEPYARERDSAVGTRLSELGIGFEQFRDHVAFEPGELTSRQGTPFTVYTPYMKAWKEALDLARLAPIEPDFSQLAPASALVGLPELQPLENYGFIEADLWLEAGQAAGEERLAAFDAVAYAESRDYPARSGTSGLSVHLRHGTVAPRAAIRKAMDLCAEKWLNELIWREFYQSILGNFPFVASGCFRPEFDAIKWPGMRSHLAAWKSGMTGYPLVDAAMRHFAKTGWMHNRLRMVVASFLVKDLLIDWREGEAHFARYLLDFELASNNGGWQWCAGTGCDAQPYFRIFNPVLQSRKFDPDGTFIRDNLPELAGFSDALIHAPWEASHFEQLEAGCEIGVQYPGPIVVHSLQKDLATRLFKQVQSPKG